MEMEAPFDGLLRTSNFIDDEEFFVLSDLFRVEKPAFRTKIIQLSTE